MNPCLRLASTLLLSVLLPAALLLAAPRAAAQVRLAFIDPLSGPLALTGELAQKRFRDEVESVNRNAPPGGPWELQSYDNKGNVQESLAVLRQAIDRGARYVIQGQSSAVATALIEAINRHNEREPERSVVFLNYAATDPTLTESRCSFWHFRFDAHIGMRMEALASHLARDASVKRVYLVVQDYSFGHEFARAARQLLTEKRPDIQVVGEDRHPIGQVRDFAPYIAKIRAAQADAVLTGNWGNDLNLLVKAARESGLKAGFLTFYAGSPGAVAAMGEAAAGRVSDITDWHLNAATPATAQQAAQFRERYGSDYHFARATLVVQMLAAAVRKAGSGDPLRVAYALEGLRAAGDTGEVEMRAADHQLLLPLLVAGLERSAAAGGPAEVRAEAERSGLGWRTLARLPAQAPLVPGACQMKRPAAAR